MIEEAIGHKWSKGGFTTRIDSLRTKFKIILGFKKALQALLDEANLLRNCILHNGSKVSRQYLEQFGEKRNLILNTPINLSPHFIRAIFYLSIDFIRVLFVEVSKIAFKPSMEW